MSEQKLVDFESLIGLHVLSGVDVGHDSVKPFEWTDTIYDVQFISFRLDGKVYTAFENPDDGYRSSMEKLVLDLEKRVKNFFPPVKVFIARKPSSFYGQNDVLLVFDVVTGKVVMEFGTDTSDDYYPSFVASFSPENMVTNSGLRERG